MDYGFREYAGVLAGYATSLGGWFVLTRARPALWPPPDDLRFARPGRELQWAGLAALGVILLNFAYHAYAFAWVHALAGAGKAVAFVASLALIWSPVIATLAVRRQGPETCLVSPRGWPKKLAWGFVASAAGVAAFLLVHQGDVAARLTRVLTAPRPVPLFQSLLQFFGFGFLLVRLGAVLGRGRASLLCGALYGLVKYPLYLGPYGLSFVPATSLVVFSAAVAAAVVYLVHDRRDLVVPAIVHVFMDAVQRS
jgi:hypothetical protein